MLALRLLRLAGEERIEALAGRLVHSAEVRELHGVRGAALGQRTELGGVAEGLDQRQLGLDYLVTFYRFQVQNPAVT